MKKITSFICMFSLSFCFAACGEDDEEFKETNLSVNEVDGEYTCKGNGTMCIAKNYLLTCKDNVATIEESSSECADAIGEYIPPEKRPASFDCQYEQMNQPKCTCTGTGSSCQSGWNTQYYLTCTAGKMGNVKTCRNGCDESGCL